MGCCASRPADGDNSPPQATSQPHALPTASNAPQGQSPRLSTSSRQSGQQRRYLNPAARFNEPLKQHVFVSKTEWTPSRLQRERRDFFDTRVSGRPEVWNCIRTAAELFRDGDAETAQMMMNATGLTIPTGDMVEGVYDSSGAYYQLPDWTVADPSNLQQDEETETEIKDDISALKADVLINADKGLKNEKGKGKAASTGDAVALKARLSDRATDIKLTVFKTDTIGEIIERIREESGITARVRLAYLGHILSESQSLEASGWKEGHVVNAMVFTTS